MSVVIESISQMLPEVICQMPGGGACGEARLASDTRHPRANHELCSLVNKAADAGDDRLLHEITEDVEDADI